MPLSLMLDILIAVLLVVTIVYAIILNRRLGNLRRDREELEQLAICGRLPFGKGFFER